MKCIGAFSPSVSVQTGENIPGNVYTQSNLLAGKGIEIVDEPVEGGIDNHTLACWHFDGDINNAAGDNLKLNYPNSWESTTSNPKFGTGKLDTSAVLDISNYNLTDKTSFTLDFWLDKPESTPEIYFGLASGTGGWGYQPTRETTFIVWYNFAVHNKLWVKNSTGEKIVDVPAIENWNTGIYKHFALTYDGTEGKASFFIDGILKTSVTFESTVNKNLTSLYIYSSDEVRLSDIVRYTENFVPPIKPYSLAIPTGNKVINNTLDVSSLVTKEEVSTGLSTKQDTITGSNGEVAYHNGTSVFTQSILNLGYTCASAAEVNQCKNNAPSFSAVFNTWKKFSHKNATNDAIPSEMTAWTYDSGTDTITQPLNTESYVGFISPKSYSSYDITVRCYSTGADDDSIGLVAAFAKDSNGLEHTLSFIRSPGGTSAKWVAILDYNQFALTGTSYGQKILVNKSAASTTPSSTASWNTESIGTGTVIKMVRSGNVITAKCSQFNSNTIDDNTLITVDLDALSDENPTLNLFKGSSPWGYSNFSQPNSKYENISVTDPDGMIFDIPNNQVLQYSNGTWVVVSGQTPISAIGAGRLSYNSVTGKLFFCTGTDIIQIGKNTDI